jgi:uncharacterized protein (UPF0332 family)
MAEPLYLELINLAEQLANSESKPPNQAHLRRAVSTAYYALFHFLINQSTLSLLGNATEYEFMRHAMSRAFEHGEMASVAKSFSKGELPAAIHRYAASVSIRQELKDLAALFVDAQESRHRADYDVTAKVHAAEARALIDRVKKAIKEFSGIVAARDEQFFLLCLLVWNRIKSR